MHPTPRRRYISSLHIGAKVEVKEGYGNYIGEVKERAGHVRYLNDHTTYFKCNGVGITEVAVATHPVLTFPSSFLVPFPAR